MPAIPARFRYPRSPESSPMSSRISRRVGCWRRRHSYRHQQLR
uniref:Uncharacterized protein MANES_11G157400 n=1 Tax=Rhizophora mucronata TaxID=61149 RepID=A0A2P2IYM2_RHIMU